MTLWKSFVEKCTEFFSVREHRWLFGLTLLTRAGYIFLFKWKDLLSENSEYDILALRFLETGKIIFNYVGKDWISSYMSPGVVGVLVVFRKLFPHAWGWPLAITHVVLASWVVVLVYWITAEAFGRKAAFWSSVAYALDVNLMIPVAWKNETVYTLFFFAWVGVALAGVWRRADISRVALLGFILGGGALFRSTLLIQILPASFWVGVCRKSQRMGMGRGLVVLWVFFGIVLLPWTVRNYLAFKKFVPVSQNLGVNLWQGWNPSSAGSEFGWTPMIMDSRLQAKLRLATSEPEYNSLLVQACVRWAKEDPKRWFEQRMLSYLWFWHQHNYWIPLPQRPYPQVEWRVIASIDLIFLFLFFTAVLLSLRKWGFHVVILSCLLIHSMVHGIIHGSIGSRFRYQMEPLMLPFIGFLVNGIFSLIKQHQRVD